MRGNEFLDKMELIDPTYIEAADAAPKVKRTVWTSWRAAMAACLCVVLLAGTAAAVSGAGTWLVKFLSSEGNVGTGYELSANIGRFPTSALSENLQAVSEEIIRQFQQLETGVYAGDWGPECWVNRDFSADEAWAFIGLESMQKTPWDLEECFDMLTICGSSTGEIERILIFTGYQMGDIRLQADAEIYTENYTGELRKTMRTIGSDVRFAETFLPTPSGNSCQVISSSVNELGRLDLTGYLVENSVLYQLHISYQEPDAARAEELLRQWADMF